MTTIVRKVDVNCDGLMKRLSVKIKLKGWLPTKIRFVVGIWLIKMAAFIMPCDVELEKPVTRQ